MEPAERVAAVPYWWHSIEVAPGVVTPGVKSPQQHAQELTMLRFPDLRGKRVLDIGGWDGFYAFHAEALGAAEVTVLDHFVWSIDLHGLTNWRLESPGERMAIPAEETSFWQPDRLPGKAGFDTARELRGSRVGAIVGDFMTMPLERVGVWDVTLFLGVLYHLQNPLGGLRRLAAMTGEQTIVESHAVSIGGHPDASLWTFYPTDELANDPSNWFAPTAAALKGGFVAAGFSSVELLTDPPSAPPGQIVDYRAALHAFK
jgi:tRNA (mo5U34)-methyltransferase